MTDDQGAARLDPPPTVAGFVRSRYRDVVRKYLVWASLSTPMFAAARFRQSGFSWETLGAAALGGALACLIAAIGVWLGLSVAGWWKIHTKVSPYVPASILLVVAVLGYIAVTNFYCPASASAWVRPPTMSISSGASVPGLATVAR